MISANFILLTYSTIASIIIVVLSALYHGCGHLSSIQGNTGLVDEKNEYEIGLINESINSEECDCWTAHLPLTVLEIIVIGALCSVGLGLVVKLGIHWKGWMTNRTEMIREKKLIKTAKMRKSILEEYQKGFPAHPDSSEGPGIQQGKVEFG